MASCATCKWWVSGKERISGACRLNPPSTTLWGKTVWPKTSSRDSCSHHEYESTGAQSEPARRKQHNATTRDTNILKAIPETKDYRLLVCTWYVRPGIRASFYRDCMELMRSSRKDGLEKAKSKLTIEETHILGWIISINNGPFYPEQGFEDFPKESVDSPTLVPITLSSFFIQVGYRIHVGPLNPQQNTRFAVLHPNKREVTNLSTSFTTRREDFEEAVLLDLLESSNKDVR